VLGHLDTLVVKAVGESGGYHADRAARHQEGAPTFAEKN